MSPAGTRLITKADTDVLHQQLSKLGFEDAALSAAFTRAGFQDVTQLADMSELDVRATGGLNFAKSRVLIAEAKKELTRREQAEAAQAARNAGAEKARVDAVKAGLLRDLKDETMEQMLMDNDLLLEVGPVLVKEGLITLADLEGVGKDILIQLGVSAARHVTRASLSSLSLLSPSSLLLSPHSNHHLDHMAARGDQVPRCD